MPVSFESHAESLYSAFSEAPDARDWTYLPYGPFANQAEFSLWLENACSTEDPSFFSVLDQRTNRALGILSLMRFEPRSGCIEVGHVHFAPALQKTPAATEASFLLMQHVFDDLAYRRLEWKCDALNQRSRAAAERLGFSLEGTFRQHLVYKGRNRDTSWYSMLDSEWPDRRTKLARWLAPSNFDAAGYQRHSLERQSA